MAFDGQRYLLLASIQAADVMHIGHDGMTMLMVWFDLYIHTSRFSFFSDNL